MLIYNQKENNTRKQNLFQCKKLREKIKLLETVISKEIGETYLIVTLKLPKKTTLNQIIT